MAPPPDFTFRLVPVVLRLLEARGVPEPTRAQLVDGLPAGAATAPLVTAPLERVQDFLARAEAVAGVPSLGVLLAVEVPRGTYAWLEFIARLAPTLEDGMKSVGRFYRLVNAGAELAYFERGECAGLDITVHGRRDGWGRQLNEYTVALLHRITRELSPSWRPTHVWLAHDAPAWSAQQELAAFFGVRPTFGAPTNGFDGPAELVDVELPGADRALCALLTSQARAALEAQVPLAALAARVRDEVKGRLGRGAVGIEAVSAALGLSARTLQRRLREEGSSYQQVLDAVRAQAAKDWLANAQRSVGELAARLGYSEPGAFDRAFRRWTGQSPSAWRAAALAGRPPGVTACRRRDGALRPR